MRCIVYLLRGSPVPDHDRLLLRGLVRDTGILGVRRVVVERGAEPVAGGILVKGVWCN